MVTEECSFDHGALQTKIWPIRCTVSQVFMNLTVKNSRRSEGINQLWNSKCYILWFMCLL